MTLTLDSVTVTRGGRRLLDRLDLTFLPGRVAVIVGPNGAGKSTAMNLASGALRCDGGEVRLDGASLGAFDPMALARRRAVVTQSPVIAFPFRVHEVVAMGRAPHGGPRATDARIVDLALERFDLNAFADRAVTTLSGGERQRVHLARAFAQVWDPPGDGQSRWLLLDEPLTGLDPRHQLQALEAARDFARMGGGALVVLHDLRLARAYADDLIALDRGARVTAPDDEMDAALSSLFRLDPAESRHFL